jgi:hypothetical protein
MLYRGVGKPQSLVEATKAVRDNSRGLSAGIDERADSEVSPTPRRVEESRRNWAF